MAKGRSSSYLSEMRNRWNWDTPTVILVLSASLSHRTLAVYMHSPRYLAESLLIPAVMQRCFADAHPNSRHVLLQKHTDVEVSLPIIPLIEPSPMRVFQRFRHDLLDLLARVVAFANKTHREGKLRESANGSKSSQMSFRRVEIESTSKMTELLQAAAWSSNLSPGCQFKEHVVHRP